MSSLELSAPEGLEHLVQQLRAGDLPRSTAGRLSPGKRDEPADFTDVVGQLSAKRALEVAAAGGHNVLLRGPPGAGKTMLARRVPTILPALNEEEALEVVAIHSVAGVLDQSVLTSGTRPFRAPHHTISSAGLIGGGSVPRPGEVSLAHHGVLFLDEMLEFPRHVLDALRQPMEDARVVIARASQAVSFPARFTLIGASNPCPCGMTGEANGSCNCAPGDIDRYSARLSGPLADRIDMYVTVGAVPLRELSGVPGGDCSAAIRARVERARESQRRRFSRLCGVSCNAFASGRWLDSQTPISKEARSVLHTAADRLSLSARGYHRVLKVARTIADLEEEREIGASHVGEALRYRPATGPSFARTN